MLMAPASPCHGDHISLIPHLPGLSLGMLQHVVCAVQAALESFELLCWRSDFTHSRVASASGSCRACPEPCALRGAAPWAWGAPRVLGRPGGSAP